MVSISWFSVQEAFVVVLLCQWWLVAAIGGEAQRLLMGLCGASSPSVVVGHCHIIVVDLMVVFTARNCSLLCHVQLPLIQENIKELQKSYSDSPIGSSNDLFSIVRGEERTGCVRMLGFGPTPSDVWGPSPSKAELINNAKKSDEEARAAHVELQESISKMQASMTRSWKIYEPTMITSWKIYNNRWLC
ncbi:uncharacterized protein LOC132280117 isoform X2 [Cornus florida]|nr:uncharacterized protein LOC132280117 isoform X2 [Cornus florida]